MPLDTVPCAPAENRLLAVLPRTEYHRLRAHMEHIPLPFAEVLSESGELLRHVYFVNDGLVSLLYRGEQGESLEVGSVGHEGMIGLPIFLGVDTAFCRAQVQGAGSAMRMSTEAFLKDLAQEGQLEILLHRYTHALLAQITLSAACSRFHSVEARLARWLLTAHDHSHSDEVRITQAFIASLLGIRREGITHAASTLQKRHLIHYRRGHLQILDRAGLEAAACTCYRIIKERYEGYLHSP